MGHHSNGQLRYAVTVDQRVKRVGTVNSRFVGWQEKEKRKGQRPINLPCSHNRQTDLREGERGTLCGGYAGICHPDR